MIDGAIILREFLAAQSPLTTLTGLRIWEERAYPLPGYKPSQGPALCFRSRGGSGLDYSGNILHHSWQFKCYGKDEEEANRTYRTLFDVLNEKQTGGLYRAWLEIPGQVLNDPNPPNWLYNLSFFETLMLVNFVPA